MAPPGARYLSSPNFEPERRIAVGCWRSICVKVVHTPSFIPIFLSYLHFFFNFHLALAIENIASISNRINFVSTDFLEVQIYFNQGNIGIVASQYKNIILNVIKIEYRAFCPKLTFFYSCPCFCVQMKIVIINRVILKVVSAINSNEDLNC